MTAYSIILDCWQPLGISEAPVRLEVSITTRFVLAMLRRREDTSVVCGRHPSKVCPQAQSLTVKYPLLFDHYPIA